MKWHKIIPKTHIWALSGHCGLNNLKLPNSEVSLSFTSDPDIYSAFQYSFSTIVCQYLEKDE